MDEEDRWTSRDDGDMRLIRKIVYRFAKWVTLTGRALRDWSSK